MKRIKIIILLLLITILTGCRCEYNLTINGDNYSERVTIIGDNSNEIKEFDESWQVPTDKNDYSIGLDDPDNLPINSNIYDYSLSSNSLTFSNNFTKNKFNNSTAVSNCYNNLTLTTYDETTIISSSPNAICFDRNPSLNSVTVNITINGNVTSNNADSVNNNTYTWRLNRQNANSKSIDLVIEDYYTSLKDDIPTNNNSNNNDDNVSFFAKDKDMYIFGGILLVVLLFGYSIIDNIKNKEDDLDDMDE